MEDPNASLLAEFERFTSGLGELDRRILMGLLEAALDPLDRAAQRPVEELLNPAELALLRELEAQGSAEA